MVTRYLAAAGLMDDLEALGFHVVGYGCTTCIGNSGPLPEPIAAAIRSHGLVAAAVLSGNRNFEGRISPDVRANYLASPPLVVAYALAGTVDIDLDPRTAGVRPRKGGRCFLADLWPGREEVARVVGEALTAAQFREAVRRASSPARRNGSKWRPRPGPCTPGTRPAPTSRSRPSSPASPPPPGRWPRSGAPGSCCPWATR